MTLSCLLKIPARVGGHTAKKNSNKAAMFTAVSWLILAIVYILILNSPYQDMLVFLPNLISCIFVIITVLDHDR